MDLPVVSPLAELGLAGVLIGIILSMVAGLYWSVSRGHLVPRSTMTTVQDAWASQVRAEHELAETWHRAYESEREARLAVDAAVEQLVEQAHLTNDMLIAWKDAAERTA